MLLRIDLTKPLIRLEYIFLEYGIPVSILYDMKDQGVVELFIEKKDKFEVVFTVHSNGHLGLNDGSNFMMDKEEIEMIDDVRSFAENAEIPVVLDVDSILDKISKYGTNSLVKEEFDYLYSYK
jgi:hypothetical protein